MNHLDKILLTKSVQYLPNFGDLRDQVSISLRRLSSRKRLTGGGGYSRHMKRSGMLVVSLVGKNIKDSGLTWDVHNETPLFLAVKVSFRVHSKKE